MTVRFGLQLYPITSPYPASSSPVSASSARQTGAQLPALSGASVQQAPAPRVSSMAFAPISPSSVPLSGAAPLGAYRLSAYSPPAYYAPPTPYAYSLPTAYSPYAALPQLSATLSGNPSSNALGSNALAYNPSLAQLSDAQLSQLLGRPVSSPSTNESPEPLDLEEPTEAPEPAKPGETPSAEEAKSSESGPKASSSGALASSTENPSEKLASLKAELDNLEDIDDTAERAGVIVEAGVRDLIEARPELEPKIEEWLGFLKNFGQDPLEFAEGFRRSLHQHRFLHWGLKLMRPLVERMIRTLPRDTANKDYLLDRELVKDLFDWLMSKPDDSKATKSSDSKSASQSHKTHSSDKTHSSEKPHKVKDDDTSSSLDDEDWGDFESELDDFDFEPEPKKRGFFGTIYHIVNPFTWFGQ